MEKYGTAEEATDGSIRRSMRIACWTAKATESHSEYVTLTAFPWQRESASMLGFTYIACPVLNLLISAVLGVPGYKTDDQKYITGRDIFFSFTSRATVCLTLQPSVAMTETKYTQRISAPPLHNLQVPVH